MSTLRLDQEKYGLVNLWIMVINPGSVIPSFQSEKSAGITGCGIGQGLWVLVSACSQRAQYPWQPAWFISVAFDPGTQVAGFKIG